MPLVQRRGTLTLLRVHDVGTGYGPPEDQIDVEVVIGLDRSPNERYGFQLRSDGQRAARQGMLDLLRDAYQNNWEVAVDADLDVGKTRGVMIRVWVER